MLKFISKYFDYNERELSRLRKQVEKINSLTEALKKLKESDFKTETEQLKKQLQDGVSINEILPRAYGLVREAADRVLGIRHFDVQLMAGIALHEGKIVEQKTGEGKTLTATSALYLNALTGKGAHLVTVNDYLARRDAGWMGAIFHYLGLQTSAIISDQSFLFDPEYVEKDSFDARLTHLRPISRKEAYKADITYGINSEFGFDYLRDNMAGATDDLRQRGFYYAIIDEADSVLIDEARTPHIISAPFEQDTSKYYQYSKIVKQLNSEKDYIIDEKLRTANLTEEGIHHIEQLVDVDNIYEQDFDTLFHIEAALKAEALFKLDKDYIVKDGEVIIVDEFTGRLLQGRRFSEGLHQAIEAKEQVQIQKESKTLATVSLQNYFRMYEKLGGMTGTAATEAEEFNKIYKTDVIVLPTHRQMVRKDQADMIYKTERAKFNAVVEEITKEYKAGRPVLVGTTSIEKNEYLSRLLNQRGVHHELLNAKNHEREAQIISRAGEKSAVTVATNMAGRGVDIVLGGATPDRDKFVDKKTGKVDEDAFKKAEELWDKKHDEVVELGGLYVMGTERHESRRIDNQLRGRSGRQGDPGTTVFFVSLEDDLMRIFGGEQISKLMTFLNFPEDQPLSHPMVSRAIEQAQVKVEGFNFDIRKHLVDFDDVLNRQREIIYSLRKKMLELPEKDPEGFKQTIFDIFSEEITSMMQSYIGLKESLSDEELAPLMKDIEVLFPGEETKVKEYFKKHDFEGLQEYLLEKVRIEYEEKEKKLTGTVWHSIIRMIFLSTIDQYWTQHLTSIEDLREGINLRGFAQLDPLVEYKNEAFSMFERLVNNINYEVTRRLFRIEIDVAPQANTPVPDTKEVAEKPQKVLPEQKKEKKKMEYKPASGVDAFKTAQKQSPTNVEPVTVMPNKSVQTEVSQEDTGGFKVTPPGAIAAHKDLGRNDPCWCGSGKKYKKCHYPN